VRNCAVMTCVEAMGASSDASFANAWVCCIAAVRTALFSSARGNSLFCIKNSLLPQIISLITFLGKSLKNPCGTGVFCTPVAPKSRVIGIFPVNFLVSRENRLGDQFS
jgi:hypothetical protein